MTSSGNKWVAWKLLRLGLLMMEEGKDVCMKDQRRE
jgi:hypothetical protein